MTDIVERLREANQRLALAHVEIGALNAEIMRLSPRLVCDGELRNPIPWPGPTPEMLESPEFEAVWQCLRRWDINVPDAYAGYCGATGNHVRAILDALSALPHRQRK